MSNTKRTEQSLRSGTHGCEEFAQLSRRGFLGGAGVAAAGLLTPAWLPKVAMAAGSGGGNNVIVKIFLRGGMDGLTTLAPHGDPELYLARPDIAIDQPGMPDGALDLDGFFGLAPSAAPLLTPWSAGDLAFIHACGSTNDSKSHFSAMAFMESGAPLDPAGTYPSGWLARVLQTSSSPSILRGISINSLMPQSMAQAPASLPIADPANFSFPGSAATAPAKRSILETLYSDFGTPMEPAALSSFATIDLLETIDFAGYVPDSPAVYPATNLAESLKSAAALIKADVGVEVLHAEMGHWDLHNALGPIAGDMADNLTELTEALEAFYLDTLSIGSRVVVVVGSEFGRRVAQNGSLGVDHGRGTAWLVMGTPVLGGSVYGTWPGLAPANLDGGNLAVTTDYRDVLSEVVQKHLGNFSASVFPGHSHVPIGLLP